MYQSKPWSPVSTQILWICLFIHFRISAGYRCLVILSQKIQHLHDNLWIDVSHIFVFIGISSNVKQPDVLFWRFTVIFHLMQRLHVRWWNPATISWRKYTILTIKSSSYLCMSKHTFCQQLKLLLCNKIREICWRNMTGAFTWTASYKFPVSKAYSSSNSIVKRALWESMSHWLKQWVDVV